MRPSSLLHRAAILFSTLLLAITPLAASAEAFIFTVDGGNLASRHFTGTSWLTVLDFIPVSVYGVPAWGGSDFIRLGDFNGDGRFEVASPRGGHILVKYVDTRLNSLNSAPPASVSGQWGGASYVRVGDFNGDGRDDFASPNGGSVYMKLGRSGVYRFDSQTWGVQPSWGGSAYTFVGDFNGDGRDDIASGSGGSMYMKISTGSGFISQTWNVSNEWASGGYTWVGDFNGDGLSDIASANGGTVYMKISTGVGFSS
ncbi:MAG: VCBS repeat-containing protein, partial [Acidobacteriota bacterium]